MPCMSRALICHTRECPSEADSAGVHESQSRLWENIVGRSHGFWEYMYPSLQAKFPEQLKGVSLSTFYAAINKVEKSLIRTDADEVTYNLHVMLRFDFEVQLLEGSLSIGDLLKPGTSASNMTLELSRPTTVMVSCRMFTGTLA